MKWAQDPRRYEPACGAAFDPYGPVELGFVTSIVAQAALDAFSAQIRTGTHRIWLARRALVEAVGGTWSEAICARSQPNRDRRRHDRRAAMGPQREEVLRRDLVRHRPSRQRLFVRPTPCSHHFDRHRQTRFWHREAGGLLFARLAPSDDRSLRDHRSPTNRHQQPVFVPARRMGRAARNRRDFSRNLHFVGCWHTHPEDVASPSHIDVRNTSDCVRRSHHSLTGFLLVVGFETISDSMFVSICDRSSVHEIFRSMPPTRPQARS